MNESRAKARVILSQIDSLAAAIARSQPPAGADPDPDPVGTLELLFEDFARFTLVGNTFPFAVTSALRSLRTLHPDPRAAVPLAKLHNYFRRKFVEPRFGVSVTAGEIVIDGVAISGVQPKVCEILSLLWAHAPRPVSQAAIRRRVPGTRGDKTIRRLWDKAPWQAGYFVTPESGRGHGLALRLPDESVCEIVARDEPPENVRV